MFTLKPQDRWAVPADKVGLPQGVTPILGAGTSLGSFTLASYGLIKSAARSADCRVYPLFGHVNADKLGDLRKHFKRPICASLKLLKDGVEYQYPRNKQTIAARGKYQAFVVPSVVLLPSEGSFK